MKLKIKKKSMIEIRPGKEIEIAGRMYEAIEAKPVTNDCEHCALRDIECKEIACTAETRKDKLEIIFKEV